VRDAWRAIDVDSLVLPHNAQEKDICEHAVVGIGAG
jgi:hypothetical protein